MIYVLISDDEYMKRKYETVNGMMDGLILRISQPEWCIKRRKHTEEVSFRHLVFFFMEELVRFLL